MDPEGHCHINLDGSQLGRLGAKHAGALPNYERRGSKLFVYGLFEKVALVVEGVVSRGVDVEEVLHTLGLLAHLGHGLVLLRMPSAASCSASR
jgi:hypothetical protein